MHRIPLVTCALAVALSAVYLGFQHGQLTLGVSRTIEFRCNAVEHGLIPYEVTHAGSRLTDPYCEPQPGDEDDGHGHERTDPGLVADAPTWLTPFTATVMHGGLLHLAGSVLALLVFGPRLERRLGRLRFLGLFLAGGAATAAALVLVSPNLPIATVGATGAAAAIVGAHLGWWRGSRIGLVAAWVALEVAVADLDAAQPVAGVGGDVAYLAPAAGLILGLLVALKPHPRSAPEVQPCRTSAPQS